MFLRIVSLVVYALATFSSVAGGPTSPVTMAAATAQAAPAGKTAIPGIAARPEDVSTIDGIIKAYYEVVSGPAEKPREWGRDATLYMPGIRFIELSEDASGKVSAHSMSHQEFVDSFESALHGKAFYEREVHRITHRAGNAVQVLTTSEHFTAPGGPVLGHSVDNLQLYWDGTRWWIASDSIWSVERADRPLPAEFLPAK
ncbi:MAG TPA: hypothetical protein VMT51_02775 [Dongiaceae bacterium]|nr:hypothetical protein [Dongiaceae bacterium]